MFKALKRFWKYAGAKVNSLFNEHADPKIQIEQAIMEAQKQHALLRGQAASVIGQQKQAEMRLDRAMGELEKVSANAKQAVLMADEATAKGDTEAAEKYTASAQVFATQLISKEEAIEDLKTLVLQNTQAAEQAKVAVDQNATALQRKLSDRTKLLSQLDQVKMQEQINKAMGALSATAISDVPSLEAVRDKIESRYAKAKGMSELTEASVESHMLEIEQAAANSEAHSRLAQIRAQLGLKPAEEPEAVTAEATAEAQPEEATASGS